MLVLDGESAADDLRFTPDGTRLIAARLDGSVDAWTLATGERVELFAPLDPKKEVVRSVALHPTGAVRAASGNQPVAVSLSGQRPITVSGVGGVQQLIISPGANWVIVGRWGTGGSQELAGCRCRPDLDFGGEPVWKASSQVRNERLAGFLGAGERFVTRDSGVLVVRDVTTGEVRTTVKYTSHYCRCCAVSPDGHRFAVMGYDKLYLWNTATWEGPTRVSGLNRWIKAMAFHPTRPILLAVQNLQTLTKFLDADTGKPISKFNWKLGQMTSAAFSPDGTLAAAGSTSGKVVVWDVD